MTLATDSDRVSFGWFARRGFTHSENQLLYVNMSKLVEKAIALDERHFSIKKIHPTQVPVDPTTCAVLPPAQTNL